MVVGVEVALNGGDVRMKTEFFHVFELRLECASHNSGGIDVFEPNDPWLAKCSRELTRDPCGTKIADMKSAGGGGCETNARERP